MSINCSVKRRRSRETYDETLLTHVPMLLPLLWYGFVLAAGSFRLVLGTQLTCSLDVFSDGKVLVVFDKSSEVERGVRYVRRALPSLCYRLSVPFYNVCLAFH